MKKVVIMGAGPAGLTAAYELARNGIKPIVIERDNMVGGIARTVRYKDYRFDIGGHRFFTKNSEIEKLWKGTLKNDFLIRPRLSRWYFQKKFFEYPIKPLQVVELFGFDSINFILSYLNSRISPVNPEISAADWYINQFGRSLAEPFFIKYNEKLWGIPCSKLSMDFGKQRVRGISFFGTVIHHFRKTFRVGGEIASFIDQFYYPKYGPGMMWEKFKEEIEKFGGKFFMESEITQLNHENNRIVSITIRDKNKKKRNIFGDYFLSSIPLRELILLLKPNVPQSIIEAANSLKFRAFVSVALILKKERIFPDTWIYTHDPEMKCIRIQNFNNWSPFLVSKSGRTCLGFEYTCNFNDKFWNKTEKEWIKIATEDLVRTGFAKKEEVIDARVVKLKEVYPVYDLKYKENVNIIKDYLEKTFKKNKFNIQPIGRGGMHKYNNMDHSMLTALLAARNILGKGEFDPWRVNIEAEYHEEKTR